VICDQFEVKEVPTRHIDFSKVRTAMCWEILICPRAGVI